jgi:1,4-dihydroxy-2-naphthoyl-CoA hydrolase
MTSLKSLTSIEHLNANNDKNMAGHLGIEFTEIGDDYICAKMPVDFRTHQPLGLLHGGASVVLAETLGSLGATISVSPNNQFCVGVEINANHLSSVRSGYVHGKATPLHRGRTLQVWEIKISDDNGKLVCVSRLTVAVMNKKEG